MAPTVRAIPMFWQMIFENNVSLIIMLCEFKVNQKQQCEYYFGKPKKIKTERGAVGRLAARSMIDVSANALPDSATFVSHDGRTEYLIQVVKQKAILQGSLIKRTIRVTKRASAESSNTSEVEYSQKYLAKQKGPVEEVRIIKHI